VSDDTAASGERRRDPERRQASDDGPEQLLGSRRATTPASCGKLAASFDAPSCSSARRDHAGLCLPSLLDQLIVRL
jgi:hypothetical protein